MPNLLTFMRVPLGWYYARAAHQPRRATAVLGIALFTDMLDGWLARHWHASSAVGSVLDGLADKLFAAQAVGALVHIGRLSPRQALLLFTRELGEAALALAIVAHPATRWSWPRWEHATTAGKVTTALQAMAYFAAQFQWRCRNALTWATALMGALTALTYWQRERDRLRTVTPWTG